MFFCSFILWNILHDGTTSCAIYGWNKLLEVLPNPQETTLLSFVFILFFIYFPSLSFLALLYLPHLLPFSRFFFILFPAREVQSSTTPVSWFSLIKPHGIVEIIQAKAEKVRNFNFSEIPISSKYATYE